MTNINKFSLKRKKRKKRSRGNRKRRSLRFSSSCMYNKIESVKKIGFKDLNEKLDGCGDRKKCNKIIDDYIIGINNWNYFYKLIYRNKIHELIDLVCKKVEFEKTGKTYYNLSDPVQRDIVYLKLINYFILSNKFPKGDSDKYRKLMTYLKRIASDTNKRFPFNLKIDFWKLSDTDINNKIPDLSKINPDIKVEYPKLKELLLDYIRSMPNFDEEQKKILRDAYGESIPETYEELFEKLAKEEIVENENIMREETS